MAGITLYRQVAGRVPYVVWFDDVKAIKKLAGYHGGPGDRRPIRVDCECGVFFFAQVWQVVADDPVVCPRCERRQSGLTYVPDLTLTHARRAYLPYLRFWSN